MNSKIKRQINKGCFILALICLATFLTNSSPPDTIVVTKFKVTKYNIFSNLFKDPVEHLVLIMKDGTGFWMTDSKEDQVTVPTDLETQLKAKGYKVTDIVMIVHNHLLPYPISMSNQKAWKWFKGRGFNGYFLIYYQISNPYVMVFEDVK